MSTAIDLGAVEPLGVIGRGAHGEVWLARAGARLVALKLLRARDEAGAAALLAAAAPWKGDGETPCLPILAAVDIQAAPEQVRALGVPPPGVALAFPFVRGPTAAELCAQVGAFPAAAVAGTIAQLASALARLHAEGRGHLDVKPENVLAGEDGRLHLIDFALGEVRGTPGYAAPEQGAPSGSAAVGPAADAYALGRVGFALWSGVAASAARLRLPELPAPPPNAAPPIRAALERLAGLLRRLAAVRPEDRPPLAEAAREAEEIAGALGVPGLQAPLKELLAQAGPFARLDALAANAVSPAAGSSSPATRGRSGVGAAKLLQYAVLPTLAVALAGSGVWAFRHAAAGAPEPVPRAAAAGAGMPPAVFTQAQKDGKPVVRPLGLMDTIPPGYGGFQLHVVNDEKWVEVHHYGGDVVWRQAAPASGSTVKIALLPDDYLYAQESKFNHSKAPQSWPLTIEDSRIERWKTPRYILSAPLAAGAKSTPMRPDDPHAPTGPLLPDEKAALDRFEHPPPPKPANDPLSPMTPLPPP